MKDNNNVDPTASRPTASLKVLEIDIMPNSKTESDSEVEALGAGTVLSNMPNICNISEKIPINFNFIGVYVNIENCVGKKVYTWCRKVWKSTVLGVLMDCLDKLRLLKGIGYFKLISRQQGVIYFH